jgi:hypothetical protein
MFTNLIVTRNGYRREHHLSLQEALDGLPKQSEVVEAFIFGPNGKLIVDEKQEKVA